MTKLLPPALAVALSLMHPGLLNQLQRPAPAVEGVLAASTDVGNTLRGSTEFDPELRSYRISGGGDDVWGTKDAFRFVWTKVEGNASFAADVHIEAPVTYRLAKGMLMFRQSLDPGSPYADIALHADGHITLQYRLRQGGETRDVTLPEFNVRSLRLDREGNRFTAYVGSGDTRQNAHGVSVEVPMHGVVYVGLGVCSHNTDALQNITFDHLSVEQSPLANFQVPPSAH